MCKPIRTDPNPYDLCDVIGLNSDQTWIFFQALISQKKKIIKASALLEHQLTILPVPYSRAQPWSD